MVGVSGTDLLSECNINVNLRCKSELRFYANALKLLHIYLFTLMSSVVCINGLNQGFEPVVCINDSNKITKQF